MEDTYRFWGQKVKDQGHSDMPYSGALSDCVSFLVILLSLCMFDISVDKLALS